MKVCAICSKGSMVGNRIIRHGLSKKSGGIGLHTTAVTPRRFLPNLQRVRVRINGTVKTLQVCTSCIKSGKIKKA
ncbi:MAG TPA: 50S ribosomal protein L28 [Kiritimatiellia bacterium]